MITHPDKVLFPEDGITKSELASYYEHVSAAMLPHLQGRPVTMERYPAGIGAKGFIQKDVSKGFPEWLERTPVPKKDGTVHYPLVSDLRSLLWVVNQNCITPHVWSSRLPRLDRPDLCVFDLDPPSYEPVAVRSAALAVRALLEELGLSSYVKTSGSKGYHIVVPLDGHTEFETAARFADGCGAVLVRRHPEQLTQEFIKADREGRILIDTGRNWPGATFAAPYAVRPKTGAPVSAPCTWAELESGNAAPQAFTLRAMPDRIAQIEDPWSQLHAQGHSLAAPMQRLSALLSEREWDDAQSARRRKPKSRKPRT